MRCVQFHHLYDKDAKACGMSDTSESYYKRYREAVKKLSAQKIDEDFIYLNFSEGAYRVILQMKNEDAKTDALSYVSECLHEGEKVTDRDLKGWLKVWQIENGNGQDLTNVKSDKPAGSLPEKEPDPVGPVVLGDCLKNEPHGTEPAQEQGGVSDGKPENVVPSQSDPEKDKRQKFRDACEVAYECGTAEFRKAIDAHRDEHSSRKTAGDVIYFSVLEWHTQRKEIQDSARGRK